MKGKGGLRGGGGWGGGGVELVFTFTQSLVVRCTPNT